MTEPLRPSGKRQRPRQRTPNTEAAWCPDTSIPNKRLSTWLSDSTVSYMIWTPLICLPSGVAFALGLVAGGALSS